MKYTSFRDMTIWQSAIGIAEDVFKITDALPKKEDYGFTSQIRRSALSISANIAEAFGRNHSKEKVNFYYIARGSIAETQSHLEYGVRVGYFKQDKKESIDMDLGKLYRDLNRLIKSLKFRIS